MSVRRMLRFKMLEPEMPRSKMAVSKMSDSRYWSLGCQSRMSGSKTVMSEELGSSIQG